MSKWYVQLLAAALLVAIAAPKSGAQGTNNFFGSSVPSAANPPATAGGGAPGGGDYSDDEKRVQKKFKSDVSHAKGLIAKGDEMMKRGEAKHDDKLYKKGKIFKEIGEKRLNELQANSPIPPDIKEPKEKDKKDAAQ